MIEMRGCWKRMTDNSIFFKMPHQQLLHYFCHCRRSTILQIYTLSERWNDLVPQKTLIMPIIEGSGNGFADSIFPKKNYPTVNYAVYLNHIVSYLSRMKWYRCMSKEFSVVHVSQFHVVTKPWR